ncbi:MAG: hypothetical protein AB1705_11935 [Verrucomicrobiota bacterium]
MSLSSPWAGWLAAWGSLTAEESAALAAEDWARVARAQDAKAQLQAAMLAAGVPPPAEELRRIAGDLMEGERRNAARLAELRRQRGLELGECDSARQRLSAVRRSYGATHGRAAWQGYG